VILTGSIGMMAFVFANYGVRLFRGGVRLGAGRLRDVRLRRGAVLVLTVLNVLGVVFGKAVQNVLTVAKVLGLGLIIVAGFMAAKEVLGWSRRCRSRRRPRGVDPGEGQLPTASSRRLGVASS